MNLMNALNLGYIYLGDDLYLHKNSGLIFKYIKGGLSSIGFSEMEEKQARMLSSELYVTLQEMRPVHNVVIPDMLVSIIPVTNDIAGKLIGHEFEQGREKYPAYLSFKNSQKITEMLNARLPTENEWEYFCRAGSSDLFTFGSELPDDDELEKWLNPDCSDLEKLSKNKFGLYSLYNCEWCSNLYTKDYLSKTNTEDHVIRGGGAYFWPWQDEEWVWCLSAIRYPESELEEPFSCVRPVIEIVRC
ncbi:TPA: SUMF1/EgtB/PvdO family nonheme iron enzyme [Escherichia coli]|nr:SUMF1/EgtB/PvdO family nonheme iron enzyme [Escherichia coli]